MPVIRKIRQKPIVDKKTAFNVKIKRRLFYYSQPKSSYKNHALCVWRQIAYAMNRKNPRDIMNKADN
ncbi:hypothetical protein HMPREF9065_01237, partial [Aggregatibacter sp. oral taxon 458 str. W10330]